LFFAVFQNFAMTVYESGLVPIGEIMASKGQGEAITAIWLQIPYIKYLMPLLLIYAYMCMQTLLNGQVYTVAMVTTKNLSGFAEPPKWIKVFWAFALGIAVTALLQIGGIRPFQTVTIIAALPLVIIATMVLISFYLEIKKGWVIKGENEAGQEVSDSGK
jgi:L-carnitine/gamma-butyrobetaine antiporter